MIKGYSSFTNLSIHKLFEIFFRTVQSYCYFTINCIGLP